jgi:hypothetical protein
VGTLDAASLRQAIDATFTFRETHYAPLALPSPTASWAPVDERMAQDDELPWKTLTEVHQSEAEFLNPVFQGGLGIWDPQRWAWTS